MDARGMEERIAALDWAGLQERLDRGGVAATGPLLSAEEARGLSGLFDQEARFRSTVVMQRHGYGAGRYRYFDYPLPPEVARLRRAFYRHLAPLARSWSRSLDLPTAYPERLEDYLEACHAAGQKRATPLLLRYGPGDYNRLHQDLYGALAFPLQVVILLSDPLRDFSGGSIVTVESRARMQGRARVHQPALGEAVIFANALFPVPGSRGPVRAQLRHGVDEVTAGERTTLGLIFHDAA